MPTRFNEEQILEILKQAETGHSVQALCHAHGISRTTFYEWRHKYAERLESLFLTRLRELESENQRLKELAHDRLGELRRVTVVLADLRGFTAMSERLEPQQVVAVLNRYFERMTRIILNHGGTIDKFMGDAIMALFGAPLHHDNELQQALACAIEMQIAMDDINRENAPEGLDPLFMGIGINTGDVIAGHLGSPLHSEYTVIGDEVNLASRLEAHAMRGQILVSENVRQLAQEFIETGAANEVGVKGKRDVVRMYELRATQQPRQLRVPRREARSNHRVKVDLPVEFQVVEEKSVRPDGHSGRVADLSYGGMRIVSTSQLTAFTEIRISRLSALTFSDLLTLYGKVRKVTTVDLQFCYHIEFTAVDKESHKAIKDHVDALVQRR